VLSSLVGDLCDPLTSVTGGRPATRLAKVDDEEQARFTAAFF
jgi:hypothetical protein